MGVTGWERRAAALRATALRARRRHDRIGRDVRIGPGARVEAGTELRIGDRVHIGRGVVLRADRLVIGDDCHIADGCRLVAPELSVGAGSVLFSGVSAHAVVELRLGTHTKISRDVALKAGRVVTGTEFWMNRGADVGGGGWRSPSGAFVAGDRCHVGRNTHVNTAEPVVLGDDTAIGMDCTVATHAHWQPVTGGFPRGRGPVRFGDGVAVYSRSIVSPGVTVAAGGTVAGGSVVLTDVPERGLVAGAPARLVRIQQPPDDPRPLVVGILEEFAAGRGAARDDGPAWHVPGDGAVALCGDHRITVRSGGAGCTFDLDGRTVHGTSSALSEALRNHLFSSGLRFAYAGGYRRSPLRHDALLAAGLED